MKKQKVQLNTVQNTCSKTYSFSIRRVRVRLDIAFFPGKQVAIKSWEDDDSITLSGSKFWINTIII